MGLELLSRKRRELRSRWAEVANSVFKDGLNSGLWVNI